MAASSMPISPNMLLPVNADIGSIEVEFIDEPDTISTAPASRAWAKFRWSGVAPAIANAVYHATGRRLRDLPIRIEHLLE